MMNLRNLMPASLILVGACVSGGLSEDRIVPGQRPALRSTEAGLWFQMDKFERRLSNSAFVERDPELNAYLRQTICKIVPEHCADIKLFVLKHPYFNATMAPNGSMHVWTGLLLRVENEDQLATVLGHELAHYLNRHSVKKFNNAKATTDFLTFFSIATGGIGFGFIGLAATLGAAGSLHAYSRDLETEADKEGLSLMHKAGFRASEAAELWERIKEEKDASSEKKASVFWSTHPPTEQRISNLQEWSGDLNGEDTIVSGLADIRFDQMVQKYWTLWLEELISTLSFDEAFVVVSQLHDRGFSHHTLAFFRGEIYRRRSGEGDLLKAAEQYEQAIEKEPAPLKSHKHYGLVQKRLGNAEKAIRHFEIYLEQNPKTQDQILVKSYIKDLRK